MTFAWMDVPWLGVFLGAVAAMMLGGLWYSPVLFGNVWARLMDLNKEDIKQEEVNRSLAVAAATALIKSYGLAVVILAVGASTPLQGMAVAILVTLGVVAPSIAMNQAFEFRNLPFFGITIGNHLVGMALIGLLVGIWV